MKMQDCPKFDKCFAPICPLDRQWRKRVYLSEDRMCFYLLESQKAGASGRVEPEMLKACQTLAEDPTLSGTLRNKLYRASLTPSRIEQGQERMKRLQGGG